MKVRKKIDRTDMILHGSLWRAMLMIAVPVMLNSFLQTLYNLTDTYWLGRIGKEALGAINLVTPLQNIIVNFGSGFTVAGAVLIAQFVGAGKPERARKMANQIFTAGAGDADPAGRQLAGRGRRGAQQCGGLSAHCFL